MDILIAIFSSPFVWGLLVGLLFAAWAFFSGWGAKRALRREIQRLEDSLRTQAVVASAGRQTLLDENAELKKANENLRISLASLQAKPDKAELRQFHLYDKAVHLMYERAPGFSSAWESALKEAQSDLDKTSSGILPFLRRIIHPSLSASSNSDRPSLPPPPPDASAS